MSQFEPSKRARFFAETTCARLDFRRSVLSFGEALNYLILVPQISPAAHQTINIMWIVFSLFAALTTAVVVVLSKAGIKDVDPSLGFAVQSVMILLVSWIAVFSQSKFQEIGKIEGKAWIYLLAAGVITCVSSLLSFRALKLGAASQVSSFDKISLVFSIILAVVFLREKLTWQIVLGGLLMAGGAIIITFSQGSEKQ